MKRIIWIIIFILAAGNLKITAQQDTTEQQNRKWTLQDCINYGVDNNIGLKRQHLLTESAEIDLLDAKLDLVPSLNIGSDANLGFGRSINPVTNLITFKQNISNSYSLNSSVQLFGGFATANTISANKFMVKAGLETERIRRNTLIVQILGDYYQALYAKGIEDAAKMQLALSERQLFRITKMVETGKEALSKQYEMESKVSEDKLSYTIARNSTSQAVTSLKQLLQLGPGTSFDIDLPNLDNTPVVDENFDIDSIYNIASQILPRLKAINYELQATRKQVSAAKGGFSPRIIVGGAIYTGYYKVISEDEVIEQDPFSEQIKNNNSQALYASLTIPIFNNYTNGRNLNQAKLRRNDAELRLQLEKNNLYTEIENICLEYNRGKDEYLAAAANREYNIKSFQAVEKKFETGLLDVIGYSTAQTALFKAETEALRTKLQLLIKRLSIELYATGEYNESVSTKIN